MNNYICPICGSEMQYNTWYEEYYCVEVDEKCNMCKYHNNWSYGYTEIEFGKFSFEYTYKTEHSDIHKIEKQMNKARWSYRKKLLRTGIIKGRKYALWF